MQFIKNVLGYGEVAPLAPTYPYDYVFADTEATTDEGGIYKHEAQVPEKLSQAVRDMCDKAKVRHNMQEMISFGAVKLDGRGGEWFFKPEVNPKLYPFVTKLTGITQEVVDAANTFSGSTMSFNVGLDHAGIDVDNPRTLLVCCGKFDLDYVFTPAFLNTGITPWLAFQRVCDIKIPFQTYLAANPDANARHAAYLDEQRKTNPKIRLDCDSMLHTFDLERVKPAHSALADAKSVALIGKKLLEAGIELVPTNYMTGYAPVSKV